MTLEEKLAEWEKNPGAYVSTAERRFIDALRTAANSGVGYGWMQQVIEWEWQSNGDAAWGPAYFNARFDKLRAAFRANMIRRAQPGEDIDAEIERVLGEI